MLRFSLISPSHPSLIPAIVDFLKLQCVGEGGQGGILRLDVSLDGKWIRAEARAPGDNCIVQSTVNVILFSADSGDICEDEQVGIHHKNDAVQREHTVQGNYLKHEQASFGIRTSTFFF